MAALVRRTRPAMNPHNGEVGSLDDGLRLHADHLLTTRAEEDQNAVMALRRFILPVLLLAAAFLLGRAAITHDGVGPLEYAVMGVLIVCLLGAAARLSRRSAHRP